METEKIKLTVKTAGEVYTALQNMDTYQKVVKGEDGNERVVNITYNLGGKARWAVVKNLGKLKRINDDFIKTRDDIIKALSDNTGVIKQEETEKIAELTKQIEAVLDSEVDTTGILRIRLKDLNLDECPIPVAVLNLLSPLIDETE